MSSETFIFDSLMDSLKEVECKCAYIPKTGPNQGVECGKKCGEGKLWCKKHNPDRMKRRNERNAKKKRNKKKRTQLSKKNIKIITISKKDNKGNKLNKDIVDLLQGLKL